jgi:RNA-directed DNA polymerase
VYVANSEPAIWVCGGGRADLEERVPISDRRPKRTGAGRDTVSLVARSLKAGTMVDGVMEKSREGCPQGFPVSPILSNVYLHEVMDKWFAEVVRPRLRGRATMVRYADDIVVTCELREDAERIMEVLPKRFGKYELGLHPKKTRMVDFQRPSLNASKGFGSFDFLGFTHYWGKSRKGNWVVNGITGNIGALSRFYLFVCLAWQKWLNRRSSGRHMPWDRFMRLLERYPLPRPRIVHSALCPTANP